MNTLFLTGSPFSYMRPPQLTEKMIVAGPDWDDTLGKDGFLVSLKTPTGQYELKEILERIPLSQKPDLVVCLADATRRNMPKSIGSFRGPKVLLLADTHHLESPLRSMISYAKSEPFDRVVILYDRHHSIFLQEAGLKNLYWFPGLTFPHSDKEVAKAIDVKSRSPSIAFAGQAGKHHPRRRRLLDAMKEAKLPVQQKTVSQTESISFYASSLASFNASLNGDLNLRFFEILAAGSLLITDHLSQSSGLDLLKASGCEFAEYSTQEELLDLAKHFIAKPREAYLTAVRGKKWFDEFLNEEERRKAFTAIAFDGKPHGMFPLQEHKAIFSGSKEPKLDSFVCAYEFVQELHRRQEEVRVATDGEIGKVFLNLISTLPRCSVAGLDGGTKVDAAVVQIDNAFQLAQLDPSFVWIPGIGGQAPPDICENLKQKGYSQAANDPSMFFKPFPAHPVGIPQTGELLSKARSELAAGNFQIAINAAREALAANPNDSETLKLLSEILLKIPGKAPLANQILKQVISLNPADHEVRSILAEAAFAGGNLEEAMGWVRESIAIDPSNLRAMLVLGKIHDSAGNHQDAIDVLKLAVETHPKSVPANLEFARLLKKTGQTFEALKFVHRIASNQAELPAIPAGRVLRVGFLVQHPQGWTNFSSLFESMRSDSRFEPTIIAAPYRHPYPPEGGPDAVYGFLDRLGLPYKKWDSGILRNGFVDILFVQNPYDITRPPELHTFSLMRLVPRLAYIPYGLEIGGGNENTVHQFNLPLQQNAWIVFARSPRHKAMYGLHCASGNQHVEVTGHPKIDSISSTFEGKDNKFYAAVGSRKAFLWNPQFDVRADGKGYSTFLKWAFFFLEEFKKRPDAFLIIRPHPLLWGTLKERRIWSEGQIHAYIADCESTGNFVLDRDSSYLPAFSVSSALISDASSFLLEYAATGKPILYLPNRDGPQLNDDGDFVYNHLLLGETAGSISSFIGNVLAGVDENKSLRMQALKEFLEIPASGVAAAIKESILQKVESDLAEDHLTKKSKGHEFWANCLDTRLAEQAYYKKAADALQGGISKFLKKSDSVVDFGCGDGEACFLAAPHVRRVVGFDLSPSLVAKANEDATRRGFANLCFETLDLMAGLPPVQADAIFCLGVFSCIHEDKVWLGLLDSFSSILGQGGILVLRETLGTRAASRVMHPAGYYACYRTVGEYLAETTARSFSLVEDVELFKRSDGLENHLYFFRKC